MSPVQKTFGTALDLGSPSAMAVEASKLLFGFDPFGEVTNWVIGDWNGYNDCSDVWGNLAAFCESSATNLRKGNRTVGLTWDGNAADTATVYFEEFAKKLDQLHETFDSLKDAYARGAQLAFQLAEFLKGWLVLFCDALVIWMINMASAAAVNALPVGGQVASAAMFALAAAQALRIMKMWAEASIMFDTISQAMNLVALGISGAVAGFSSVDGFPEVGRGSYDNRAV